MIAELVRDPRWIALAGRAPRIQLVHDDRPTTPAKRCRPTNLRYSTAGAPARRPPSPTATMLPPPSPRGATSPAPLCMWCRLPATSIRPWFPRWWAPKAATTSSWSAGSTRTRTSTWCLRPGSGMSSATAGTVTTWSSSATGHWTPCSAQAHALAPRLLPLFRCPHGTGRRQGLDRPLPARFTKRRAGALDAVGRHADRIHRRWPS